MSTPQLSQFHNNSNIQIEFISRRSIADGSENTNQAVVMELEQEDVAIPSPSSSSLSSLPENQINIDGVKEGEAIPSVPSSSLSSLPENQINIDGMKEGEAIPSVPSSSLSSLPENQINIDGVKEGEAVITVRDDYGYHTPTSPRHRIPPAINCPPTPKKPDRPKRWHCIRRGTGRARRHFEIISDSCPDLDDLFRTNKKKKDSP